MPYAHVFIPIAYMDCAQVTTPTTAQLPPLASWIQKQVGVAAWLECWLSHLGVAGSSPGRDNL